MKTLRVTFKDGSQYDIPAKVIMDNALAYFAKRDPEHVDYLKEYGWSDYNLGDWATNNMNWCDVAPHAVQVKPPDKRDMDELWANADTEVINK